MELINEYFKNIQDTLLMYKKQYQLTNYEYTNLILIILNGLLITGELEKENIKYYIDLIISNRNNPIKNNNKFMFEKSIAYIVNNYFNKYGENEECFDLLINNIKNGFYFHAFNHCFFNKFNEEGIVLEDKAWDITDIKRIKDILGKNIFGISNGEDNLLFLSTNLSISPYYGLSSPTFFRKFIERDPKYLNIYLERDIKSCYESINELCKNSNINDEDKYFIIHFFKKYWALFGNNELPAILLLPKENDSITIDYNKESIINYLCSNSRTKIIRENLSRNQFYLFDCNNLRISFNETYKKEV